MAEKGKDFASFMREIKESRPLLPHEITMEKLLMKRTELSDIGNEMLEGGKPDFNKLHNIQQKMLSTELDIMKEIILRGINREEEDGEEFYNAVEGMFGSMQLSLMLLGISHMMHDKMPKDED